MKSIKRGFFVIFAAVAAFASSAYADEYFNTTDSTPKNYGSVELSIGSVDAEHSFSQTVTDTMLGTSYQEKHDAKFSSTTVGAGWKFTTLTTEFSVAGYIGVSDEVQSNVESNLTGNCASVCATGDASSFGYEAKVKYKPVSWNFEGAMIQPYAVAGLQGFSADSDEFTQGSYDRQMELSNSSVGAGLGVQTSISDRLKFYGESMVVMGTSDLDTRSTTNSGYKTTETNNSSIDYTAVKFEVGAEYFITENLSAGLLWQMDMPVNESATGSKRVDIFADGVLQTGNHDGEVDFGKVNFTVDYKF